MTVSIGKAKKALSASFIENNKTIDETGAKDLIYRAECTIRDLTEEKEADEKLTAAKSIVKDLNAGYKSTIDYERAKIAFLLGRVEELGSAA